MPLESKSPFGPTNPDAIADFERTYDLSLPEEYKRFLLDSNGATPVDGRIPVSDLGELVVVQILLGLHGGPSYCSLQAKLDRYRGLLPDWIPIGYEEGGNPILLGLSAENRGSVRLWDESLDRVHSSERPSIYPLAPDMDSFLRGL